MYDRWKEGKGGRAEGRGGNEGSEEGGQEEMKRARKLKEERICDVGRKEEKMQDGRIGRTKEGERRRKENETHQ